MTSQPASVSYTSASWFSHASFLGLDHEGMAEIHFNSPEPVSNDVGTYTITYDKYLSSTDFILNICEIYPEPEDPGDILLPTN